METWSLARLIQYDIDTKQTVYMHDRFYNPVGRLVFEHRLDYDAREDLGIEIHDKAEYERYLSLQESGLIKIEEKETEREPFW